MIPNFNSYNLINESISLRELEKGNSRGLTYGQMMSGFKSKDYEFLGNISLSIKTVNNFAYKEIKDIVPDELCEKIDECGGRDYISHTVDKGYLNTSVYGDYDDDNYSSEKLLSVLSEPNIEKVKSCFTKKGDLNYVLWNEENRYFYFIKIDWHSYYNNNNGAIGFLEMFIKIRTSGLEEVTKEVDEIYQQYLEERGKRDEERRMKREEEESNKAREEEYQKRVDTIKADVEANPENYEYVERKDLPQDIQNALKFDDVMDPPYAVYVEDGALNPYDKSVAMCYVNDDNLSKGYKFKQEFDHSKPGTYWGD